MKKEIADKIKIRDEMDTLLNTIDEEITLLLKQSSLQTELELNKSTLLIKEKEIEKLKKKHEEKIISLLNIKDISQIKLKNNFDMVQKELVLKNRHNHFTCIIHIYFINFFNFINFR